MKIKVTRSNQRGLTELGWLYSRHCFSFGSYNDPKRMGFGPLRVFNDDIVGQSKGFGMHSHENFEIISIVIEGALEHKDSMGNHGVIKTLEIQRVSAGTGISHSEFNHSAKEKVHFLQIWISPRQTDTNPSYEQKSFSKLTKNEFIEVVSGEHNGDAVFINSDSKFSLGIFDEDKEKVYKLKSEENGNFVFVIKGSIEIENKKMGPGDSAEIFEANLMEIGVNEGSMVLIIEVPLKDS